LIAANIHNYNPEQHKTFKKYQDKLAKPDLVAFYATWPSNISDLFYTLGACTGPPGGRKTH